MINNMNFLLQSPFRLHHSDYSSKLNFKGLEHGLVAACNRHERDDDDNWTPSNTLNTLKLEYLSNYEISWDHDGDLTSYTGPHIPNTEPHILHTGPEYPKYWT